MVSKKILLPGIILFSLVVVLMIYWWGYQSPYIGIDDANIYFVYMKHFAEGHGFVWNVGGERVEGFTSLVWTLFGALAYKISPSHFPVVLLIVNFLLIFFTLWSTLLFSRKLNHTEDKAIAATDVIIISLLILPLGFLEWGIITLMETGLWTFLLVHLTLQLCSFYLKNRSFNLLKFSIMIILLDMTRPESMALSLLFISILFIIFMTEKGWKPALKTIAIPMIVHVATFTSIISWRLFYFGYPFPNTYYAKVSGSMFNNIQAGIKYLFEFFYSYPHAAFVMALLVLFLILLVNRFRNGITFLTREEKIMAVLLAVIFTGLALPVLTGGDHFRYSRFYQPFLPLMYLAATSAFFWKEYAGLFIDHRKIARAGLVLPVVFSALFFSKFTMFDFLKNRSSVNYNILVDFSLAQEGRKLGENLNETFGSFKYPSLGALATGSVAYSYKGKTIDLLGLNNTIMAHASSVKEGYRNHASFDKKGFWKLRPDILGTFIGANVVSDTTFFVLPENTTNYRSSDFAYLCYKGIFDDVEFRESYFPALVKNKTEDYFVFSYYNKEFLLSLKNSGKYIIKPLQRKAMHSNALKEMPSTAVRVQ
jgi:hypothetical protein